jgi:hypothetical protein
MNAFSKGPRTRLLLASVLAPLLLLSACSGSASGPMALYRAPAISNEVDGVVFESGDWVPDLPAGEPGVSWGNHRAVIVLDSAGVRAAAPLDRETSSTGPGAAANGVEPPALDAVRVTIPWRRRDPDPSSKGVIVVDASSGTPVQNALAVQVENVSGEVVFQPNPGSSTYHVYYLPWESTGGYYPAVTYPTPAELTDFAGQEPTSGESPSRADPDRTPTPSWAGKVSVNDPEWERKVRATPLEDLPRGRVTRIQSVNDFHSFFPMEVIATPEETAAFMDGAANGWRTVAEHRDYPIRMRRFIPRHWALARASGSVRGGAPLPFTSRVLRDEAFTWQVAVVSGAEPLQDVTVTFEGFPPSWASSLTCFNYEGTDEKGVAFTKRIDVSAGEVQPLWMGVRIPPDQRAGSVEGSVTVQTANRGSQSIPVTLEVLNGRAINHGFDEPELQSRLFWLDSTLGTDPDFIIDPFEPVRVESSSGPAGAAQSPGPSLSPDSADSSGASDSPGQTLSILGRRIELGPNGLPSQIYSFFTPELTGLAAAPEPILARPLALEVILAGQEGAGGARFQERPEPELFDFQPFTVRQESRGSAHWTAESSSGHFDMTLEGRIEYDGMVDYRIALVARSDVAVKDISLPVSLVPDAADYMLGLGRKGGRRPPELEWKWAVENHQEGVWLGGIHKGLQWVLRDENYVRPLNTNFYRNQPLNLPPSWFNEGRGGIRIVEEGGTDAARPEDPGPAAQAGSGPAARAASAPSAVTAYNYSGPRTLAAGDTLHFNVRFLITPFKPIDTRTHFNTRFVHMYVPVDSVRAWGGTVVNIHHANEINPYINYPFFNLEAQRAYIDEAHSKGIKVKLYDTIRELTYKAWELFALRSLGDEILNDGEGGGHSWMQEHLVDHYHSAWHAWRVDDAAMLDKGTSRWTNYYVEGLSWLAEHQHIDGLYLDDIAFSRETVKRIVTVLNQQRPEVVIDLHSANQFNVRDGFINSAMLYMEHFPFLSRLWFGEYFEYGLDEDYWLTEVSGLPFGLMGEMLQDGGHPYRGMLYGMTARMYGNVDPRPVWQMMNDFGISESRMLGYWLDDTPVRTDHPRVVATTYLLPDRALIALASWSPEDEVVRLDVDWDALGFGAGTGSREGPDAEADLGARLDPDSGAPIRVLAPAVEGLQAESLVDLSAVSVPAGMGLFILVATDAAR